LGFRDYGFIHCEEEELTDDDLDDEFEEELTDEELDELIDKELF
jgi:hypothetical protein